MLGGPWNIVATMFAMISCVPEYTCTCNISKNWTRGRVKVEFVCLHPKLQEIFVQLFWEGKWLDVNIQRLIELGHNFNWTPSWTCYFSIHKIWENQIWNKHHKGVFDSKLFIHLIIGSIILKNQVQVFEFKMEVWITQTWVLMDKSHDK
jgi:hypothetical protein